jgi:hypothetical protein
VDGAVQLTVDGTSFPGRLRDLSTDAVLVEAAQGWPLGTRVEVQLALPGDEGEPFTVVGDVVRVSAGDPGQAVAVLFADLTPAAATRIDLFVDRESRE